MLSAETHFLGKPPKSLAELLMMRAETQPDQTAIIYHGDGQEAVSLTYRELLEGALRVADRLGETVPVGSKALLLYPPGIDFLVGFCGCALAGITPVPTCFPKPGRAMSRLDAIAAASQASVLLSTEQTVAQSAPQLWSPTAANLPRLTTDLPSNPVAPPVGLPISATLATNTLALLQFTSGSTSDPKGVMITHENLMTNLEAIRNGFGIDFYVPNTASNNDERPTIVSWLPAFHDMGLIGGLLSPLYAGLRSVIFSPRAFLSRPLTWLELVSRYRAIVTGAPNFAYQLCVERIDGHHAEGLDLSCLQVAFCGAEPIDARTLEHFADRFAHIGFRRSAFLPCYGLAEATLYVAGGHLTEPQAVLSVDRQMFSRGQVKIIEATRGRREDVVQLVSSGKPASNVAIKIVTHTNGAARSEPNGTAVGMPLPDGNIGEIWLRGSSIASGYLQSDQTFSPFAFSLSGDDSGNASYLRTGDLGFLLRGKLYVTGRLKDVIILRGRNHYPQDIEATIKSATRLLLGQVVAVTDNGPNGEGFAVVAEMARTTPDERISEIVRLIRRSVIEEHEIDPRRVILVRTASIPVTTSGKLQRAATRQLLETDKLVVRGSWYRADVRVDGQPLPIPELPTSPTPDDHPQIAELIERWMLSWLMIRGGVEESELDGEKSLDRLGLDSLSAVEMSGEIEDWLGLRLTPIVAYEHPTPRRLSHYLAKQWISTTAAATRI